MEARIDLCVLSRYFAIGTRNHSFPASAHCLLSRCFGLGTPCGRNVKARIELHRVRVPATAPCQTRALLRYARWSSGRLLRASAEPCPARPWDVILARLGTGGKVDGNSVGILPRFYNPRYIGRSSASSMSGVRTSTMTCMLSRTLSVPANLPIAVSHICWSSARCAEGSEVCFN